MEIEEGEEPEVFWIALGGREEYGSLLEGKCFYYFLILFKKNIYVPTSSIPFDNSIPCDKKEGFWMQRFLI